MTRQMYTHTHIIPRPFGAPYAAERVVHQPDGSVKGYVRKYRTVAGDHVWEAMDENRAHLMGCYLESMYRAIECVSER